MLDITEKAHVSVMISSLDKSYNNTLVGKPLKSNELYLLNIVFKLLDGCCLELSNNERRILLDLYRSLYFKSEQICPGPTLIKYQITNTPKFIQSESTDCNTYPQSNKIFYWQEDDINTLLSDIEPLIDDTNYLDNKLFDTISNFEKGIEIEYNNVGRICFLAMESTTTNYEIKDIYNNNITDAFDIVLIPVINSTLFVSKNFYSHGNINFKIKKL